MEEVGAKRRVGVTMNEHGQEPASAYTFKNITNAPPRT
jgi:hypothetical protein